MNDTVCKNWFMRKSGKTWVYGCALVSFCSFWPWLVLSMRTKWNRQLLSPVPQEVVAQTDHQVAPQAELAS